MKQRTPEQIEALKAEVADIDWWHSIDLGDGIVTPGREPNSRSRDSYMNIRWTEMQGKRVLDVGCWDGLYSFQAERYGATVIAIEPDPKHHSGFSLAKRELGSCCFFASHCVEQPLGFTDIDVVFFFGVLYHLKHPYMALQNIFRAMAPGGLLILETAVTEIFSSFPILEFCPGMRDGDITNWNYPNDYWIEAALRSIGFISVDYQDGIGSREAWHARKP